MNHGQNGDVPKIEVGADLERPHANGVQDNNLEGTVEQLKNRRESHMNKEDYLEESNSHIQVQNDSDKQKEAILEEKIKQLQNENDLHLKKEATLADTINQLQNKIDILSTKETDLEEAILKLQNENYSRIQTEATFEGTVQQLQHENDAHRRKEASLEKSIQESQGEKDVWSRKQASLETSIAELQSEKDIWLKKQASLEEKISHLVEERTALDLKTTSLEAKVEHLNKEKENWVQIEDTSKQAISSLNRDIAKLRMQVVELEESRNQLLEVNQQLMGTVSGLKLQVEKLEKNDASDQPLDELKKHDASGQEDANSQVEAACGLIDKLIAENAELVEKVNELCIKLNQQTSEVGISTAVGSDLVTSAESSHLAYPKNAPYEHTTLMDPKFSTLVEERIGQDNIDLESTVVISDSGPDVSGEIVQIPLDDNDVRDLESQTLLTNENAAVPLMDAPLIGAPFRLISFFARYVSGADLVDATS